MVRQAIDALNAVSASLGRLKAEMRTLAAQLPEYPVVMAMHGVGAVSYTHLDQSTNKCRASVKRRCPRHDNGCQHHNKGKHPLDAPKHGDYFPFPYNDDWLLHFFRLFVSAEQ